MGEFQIANKRVLQSQIHTSISLVWVNTDLVWCGLVAVAVGWGTPWLASLGLRGPSSQVLTLLVGAGFTYWRLRRVSLKNPDGDRGVFGAQRPDPLKKALYHTRASNGGFVKYPSLSLSLTPPFFAILSKPNAYTNCAFPERRGFCHNRPHVVRCAMPRNNSTAQ